MLKPRSLLVQRVLNRERKPSFFLESSFSTDSHMSMKADDAIETILRFNERKVEEGDSENKEAAKGILSLKNVKRNKENDHVNSPEETEELLEPQV